MKFHQTSVPPPPSIFCGDVPYTPRLAARRVSSLRQAFFSASKRYSICSTLRNVMPWGRSSRGRLRRMSCSSSNTHFRWGLLSAHSKTVGDCRHPGGNSSCVPPGRNTWHPAGVTLNLNSQRSEIVFIVICYQKWKNIKSWNKHISGFYTPVLVE